MKNMKQRTTFDKKAELYRKMRPGYPDNFFNFIINKIKLKDDARILEIAPGTGQATLPFAKKGYEITAIELGKNLARIARVVLKKYKKVKIINQSFEKARLPDSHFDLIYSANGIHWIDPRYKFAKTHRLLKKGGYFIIIQKTNDISDATDKLFLPIYKKYRLKEKLNPPKISKLRREENNPALFSPILFKVLPDHVRYTADGFVGYLNTQSQIIAMPLKKRLEFIKEMRDIIENNLDNFVVKKSATTLTVLRKKN